MSKKRRRKRQKDKSSLIIPIVVGMVLLVVALGAIASIESRGPQAASSALGPGNTALPQSTGPIPYPNIPRIPLEETMDKLSSGEAVLVDVRSRQAYDESHAAGAISIPEEEMEKRQNELPSDKEVILYCT